MRGRRSKKADDDQLPPHSDEAEKAVLGCVFLNADFAIPKIMEAEPLQGSMFYDNRNSAIWSAIQEVLNDGLTVDTVTVGAKLREQGLLENVGGMVILAALPDNAVEANLGNYLQILKEKHLLRQVIVFCTETNAHAFEEQPAKELIEKAQLDYLRLSVDTTGPSVKPLAAHLRESMLELHELSDKGRRITGLASGFMDLDRMTAGFQAGEVAIIAARPSVGKTALALNIAATVAEAGGAVGFFSLEMTSRRLASRLISSDAEVNLRDVISGAATRAELQRLQSSYSKLKKMPIHIDDDSRVSIIQLRSRSIQMHSEHKLALLIVDYMQLVGGNNRLRDTRAQEIGDVSAGIKAIAKDLGIPVIALAQLSRDVEKEKGRAPRLSDLRESGQIEQDADVVALMHKPSKDEEEYVPESYEVNVNIAKQRNGPQGQFSLIFFPRITRFRNAAKVPDVTQPEFNLPKHKPHP